SDQKHFNWRGWHANHQRRGFGAASQNTDPAWNQQRRLEEIRQRWLLAVRRRRGGVQVQHARLGRRTRHPPTQEAGTIQGPAGGIGCHLHEGIGGPAFTTPDGATRSAVRVAPLSRANIGQWNHPRRSYRGPSKTEYRNKRSFHSASSYDFLSEDFRVQAGRFPGGREGVRPDPFLAFLSPDAK